MLKPHFFSNLFTLAIILSGLFPSTVNVYAQKDHNVWNWEAPSSVSFRAEQLEHTRVAKAQSKKDMKLQTLFLNKGLSYPPQAILFRAFKLEGTLELWAQGSDGRFVLVKSYAICKKSGFLGPKRRLGDQQVPEGFYYINDFNHESSFLLSLGINYPNASDAVLGYRYSLGGDIYIHGSCYTIGCLPMTDDAIQELYWVAVLAHSNGQVQVPVHIFPYRFNEEWMHESDLRIYQGIPELKTFWDNIRIGYDHFETHKQLPSFWVDPGTGLYQFR